MSTNPYLLAADNSPALLPLLHENPALASSQDEHGYSLVHAAASYNHLDLLRTLIREFKVDVNVKDEDDETALFVVETESAARVLVEELGVNISHKGIEGLTAREKIEAEGDFPAVAAYLAKVEADRGGNMESIAAANIPESIPPPPEGLSVRLGTMDQIQNTPEEADPEFRRRIEELAEREDFNTPQGQAALRALVEEAVLGQGIGDERKVRSKHE